MRDTSKLYDYVPMPERKPLKRPNGKRLALMITLNLEYWELTQDRDGRVATAGFPLARDRAAADRRRNDLQAIACSARPLPPVRKRPPSAARGWCR